jgi:hypothetical protein
MHPREKIENLKDYLDQVRARPEMYLGNKKITTLYDNLQGYSMACALYGIKKSFDDKFFEHFNTFTTAHYNASPGENWKNLILEKAGEDEERALTLFFELFDSFIQKENP